jgi:hypothetical protein
LVIAATSAFVSILAFMLGDRESQGVRQGIGFLLLLVTIAFLILGAFPFVGGRTVRVFPVDQSGMPSAAGASDSDAPVCGEAAFGGNLQTSEPVFLRPSGCLSGWVSSDASTVVLPDGTTRVFETQYVLIVEDLSTVQIRGVQCQAGKANVWGCWYSADLSTAIAEEARKDFCTKKAGGNVAVMYRVSPSGFEELANAATVSCP